MIKRTATAFCLLFLCLSANAGVHPGTRRLPVMTKEGERQCLIHVPARCTSDQKWPLVFVFHGGGGTAQSAIEEGGWIEKADQEGFLLAAPEGTPRHSGRPARFVGNPQTWNDGSARTGLGAVEQGIDDVAFVDTLLSLLIEQYPVDEKQVYSTGFSNGASMSFRLARELSDRFAAVAPVAGVDWLKQPSPERPVSILYITGTADPLNPVDGGEVRIGRRFYGTKPPTLDMLRFWADCHHCESPPKKTMLPNGTVQTAFALSGRSDPVICLTLAGHGHHWPGGNSKLPKWFAGQNNSSLSATDTIWEFFKSHQLPARPARTKTPGTGPRPE